MQKLINFNSSDLKTQLVDALYSLNAQVEEESGQRINPKMDIPFITVDVSEVRPNLVCIGPRIYEVEAEAVVTVILGASSDLSRKAEELNLSIVNSIENGKFLGPVRFEKIEHAWDEDNGLPIALTRITLAFNYEAAAKTKFESKELTQWHLM